MVQILVRDKLQSLSGTARKILLNLVESIVLHGLENDKELMTIRNLVSDFLTGLTSGGHHCGSPKLLTQHQESVGNMQNMLVEKQLETVKFYNQQKF